MTKLDIKRFSNKSPDANSISDATYAAGANQDITARTGSTARIGLWALGLGFGGFLLWASLAPLDEGVFSTCPVDWSRKCWWGRVLSSPKGRCWFVWVKPLPAPTLKAFANAIWVCGPWKGVY